MCSVFIVWWKTNRKRRLPNPVIRAAAGGRFTPLEKYFALLVDFCARLFIVRQV